MPPRDPGLSPGCSPVTLRQRIGLGLVAAAGVVALALVLHAARDEREDPALEAARQAVAARLRDPASAEFGPVWFSAGEVRFVCGSVNARNGFGGMAGRERFVVAVSGSTPIFERELGETEFADVWAWAGCSAAPAV